MGQIMRGTECLFARDSSYTRHPSSPAALRKLPCLDTSLTLTEHAGPTILLGPSSPSGSYRGTTMHLTVTLPPISSLYKKSGLLKYSVEDEESKNPTAWIQFLTSVIFPRG